MSGARSGVRVRAVISMRSRPPVPAASERVAACKRAAARAGAVDATLKIRNDAVDALIVRGKSRLFQEYGGLGGCGGASREALGLFQKPQKATLVELEGQYLEKTHQKGR